MPYQLGLGIAAGLLSALLFLSPLITGAGMLFFCLAPLPLFVAGLGLGGAAPWLAVMVALVATAAKGWGWSVSYAMVAVLPVAAVLPLALIGARQRDGTVGWRPAGPLLAGLALASLLLLLFGVIWAASRESGLEGLVRNSVIPGLKAIDPSQSSDERAEVAGRLAALFPAMLLCGWQMISAANALLAQWGVKLLGWNLRPSPDYRRADLPDWMLAVLAAAAMLGWLVEGEAGYLARNVTVSLLMPYMFVGLAGIHDLMQRAGKPHFGLAIFYVVFMLALPWVIVALMGAGLARQWVRLRRRRSGRSGQEEDDGSDPA